MMRLDTAWRTGEAEVLTYHPAEMVGTKFRALTQRSKVRDLNDVQRAASAVHYLHHEGIRSHQFKGRLFDHLADPGFTDDVSRYLDRALLDIDLAAADCAGPTTA